MAPGEYEAAHPSTALLIVEVADSSLRFDRATKGPLYAEVGVPEYWIVDLATPVAFVDVSIAVSSIVR